MKPDFPHSCRILKITFMPRPLVATIDIPAMQHNLAVARKCAPHSRIWAVVKANAYGHGLARGMHAFVEADGLALIEIDGALKLREMGWQKPILLLEGFFEARDLTTVAAHRLQVAVHCDEQIEMLERSRLATSVDVHLKMNSGMNRLGFTPAAYRAAYTRLRAIPSIRSITLMTHFANADDPLNAGMPLVEQAQRFHGATEDLPGERSLSNSAAVLAHPQFAADWVRPGIMLYGGTPGGKSAQAYGLKPAMTLSSEIIGVQQIGAGDAVGYGSRFVADRPMTVGVVACGYADGYPRHAPNGTPVLVGGVRTGLVGRVSMDMLAVDLTDVPDAHVGNPVTLWGDDLPIDEVANAAGTIGYELMCALAPRVRVAEQ
jgi:alanine racemase